ncbi:hypothetical protein GCM10022280_15830 [Sphingomonas swuensis]|uniref:SAF domain-containing protein n=1 Tax=Sphingomonas swuensis TaxID=977800 RepID=A0ABP7SWI2_9SPHN
MKRQSLFAVGIAVFFGLIAVFLANTYLSAGRASAVPQDMVRVAVAAAPLDFGTPLKPEHVRFINYPKDALPDGSFTSAAELLAPDKKRVALTPIALNEVILASKITGPGAGASIAALLPAGHRAVSVRINDVSGVAGFIQPSDTVDVLITRQVVGANSNSQQVTDVLLQGTRVIAMGQRAKSDAGKPAVAKTATLEVTPLEAQKLALGQQVGDLSLVLRKPGEEDDLPPAQTVSLADLRYGVGGIYRPQLASTAMNAQQPARVPYTRLAAPRPQVRREAPRTPRPTPAAAPIRNSVEVVRGTAPTSYEVGGFGGGR